MLCKLGMQLWILESSGTGPAGLRKLPTHMAVTEVSNSSHPPQAYQHTCATAPDCGIIHSVASDTLDLARLHADLAATSLPQRVVSRRSATRPQPSGISVPSPCPAICNASQPSHLGAAVDRRPTSNIVVATQPSPAEIRTPPFLAQTHVQNPLA